MKHLRNACALLCAVVALHNSTSAQLRLISPNGGELIQEGSVIPIAWTGVSQFEIVSIEYQLHANTPWLTINPYATGLHYDWRVPMDLPTEECAIRVRSQRQLRPDGTTIRIMAGGHGYASYTAAFSNDNSHVYSVGESSIVKEWNSWTGELLREFDGAYTNPTLAVSPNDRFLAYSGNERVRIVDLVTGDTSSVDVRSQISSLEFDRESKRLVVALQSLHVKVIDISNAELLNDFVHPNAVNSAEFSPNGMFVLTACSDKTARIWTTEGDSLLLELKGHAVNNLSARYNPDNRLIITTGSENIVRIWDAGSGVLLDSLVHPDIVTYAEFSSDGSKIVTACYDNKAHVWSVADHTELFVLAPHSYRVSNARFSPDSKYIFTHNTYSDVFVWNASTGALIYALDGNTNHVTHTAFSGDGRIVTTNLDAGVRVFDIDRKQMVFDCLGISVLLGGSQGRVLHASFDASEQNVLSASEDGTVRSWNSTTGTNTFSSKKLPDAYQYVDVHKPSGRIVGTNTYGVYLFSNSGAELGAFKTDAVQRTLRKAVFSPNGEVIAMLPDKTFQDTTINVLNGDDASERYSFSALDEKFIDLAISPNSTWLVTIAETGSIRVLNALTGDQSYHFVRPFGSIQYAAFSPNGKWLAFHGPSHYIWLIDTQTWTLVDSLEATVDIKKFAWSPDSKTIVSVSIDRVDILNVDQRLITGHTFIESDNSNQTDVQFSPNGKMLATMSSNVDVFETSTWTLLNHLDGRPQMRHIQWDSGSRRILVVSLHHQPWVWELTPDSNLTDESDSVFKIWEEQTGVDEESASAFLVYPNPTTDAVHVRLNEDVDAAEYSIVNSLGVVVGSGILNRGNSLIRTTGLARGAYAVRIGNARQMFVVN